MELNLTVRHDWYQSDAKVVITILLKNAVEKQYEVTIEPERVLMTAVGYQLELDLFRPVDVERSSHKATPSKVEIVLAKKVGERWDSLERKKVSSCPPLPKRTQDWDKLAKEIQAKEAEEQQGEEALQGLFQKIYNDSTEEVRRAMNKSFMESGGTVLSTNWKEVGDKKVDVKPPDGTEFKEWKA